MEVEVIQNANVLLPNKEHENFTSTEEVIHQGAHLFGKPVKIQGKRRGEPFEYRLFITETGKIIHLNKIKPMTTTEVTLGADAKQSATVIDIPSTKKNISKFTVGGILIGAGAGYYFSAKYKKYDKKKVMLFTLGGAIAGYFAGKYVEKRKGIIVKPSK